MWRLAGRDTSGIRVASDMLNYAFGTRCWTPDGGSDA